MNHIAKVWVVNIERLRMSQMLCVNFAHKGSSKKKYRLLSQVVGKHCKKQSRETLSVWCKTQWAKDWMIDTTEEPIDFHLVGPQLPLLCSASTPNTKAVLQQVVPGHIRHMLTGSSKQQPHPCGRFPQISPLDPLCRFTLVHSLQVSACLPAPLLLESHLPSGPHSHGKSNSCRKFFAP